jgi:hypothetical protein
VIVSLRADRVLADLEYCLFCGLEVGALSSDDWQELFGAYRTVMLIKPLVAEVIGRIRAYEAEAG